MPTKPYRDISIQDVAHLPTILARLRSAAALASATTEDAQKIEQLEGELRKKLSEPIASNKQDNHFVPGCHQAAFSIPSDASRVYRIALPYLDIKPKSPKGLMYRKGLYRGSSEFGEQDNRLEDYFGVLESAAGPLLALSREEPLRFALEVQRIGGYPRYVLSRYLASLLLRHPSFQGHFASHRARISNCTEAELMSWASKFGDVGQISPEEMRKQAMRIFDWAFGFTAVIDDFTRLVTHSTWDVWIIPRGLNASFILPDMPAVRTDHNSKSVIPAGFPLSSRAFLELRSRRGGFLIHFCRKEAVRRLNELLAQMAERHAVAQSEELLRSLFRT